MHTKQKLEPYTNLLEINLREILFKLLYHKWIIIISTILSFIFALFYTSNIAPQYITSALIQVDSQLGSANSMQQMLGNLDTGLTSGGQASPAEIQIALIKSRFILQSVIKKLHLNVKVAPKYFPFIGARIANQYQGEVLARPLFGLKSYAWGGEEIAVDDFELDSQYAGMNFLLRADGLDNFSLLLNDGTLLLKGKVNQPVSNHTADYPPIKILISHMKANPGTYFKLDIKQNDEILKQLSQGLAISDLGDKNKTKTGVLQLSLQGNNPKLIPKILSTIIDYAVARNIEKKSAEASKTLDFLNRQLPNVQKSLNTAETNLNVYRAKSGTIDISQKTKIILTQLSTLEQNIADVKLKKVELLQELTAQHPFIIALNLKEKQLEKESENLQRKIKEFPLSDQKALTLERDVKVKDQLYLLLLNKIQQLQVLKAGTLSDIRVLSQPTSPLTPLPGHQSFNLFAATLFGFLFGICLVFISEIFGAELNDAELIEEQLGINTFAIIPYSDQQKIYNKKINKKIKDGNACILAKNNPKDIAIEGIRSLRTILQFTLSEARNNIICILGASPNIGKSFISVNLAQVLVDSGKKVLLIDCDLRKGKINASLNIRKPLGFSELLSGDCTVDEVVVKAEGCFDFIPTGAYPANPSELLMKPRLNAIFDELSLQYDMIIIDTPPILAVTDSIIIAKYAGINLLVIGLHNDKIKEIEMTIKRVNKNGLHVNGLILNSRKATKKSFGQYNYYYTYDNQKN